MSYANKSESEDMNECQMCQHSRTLAPAAQMLKQGAISTNK